MLFNSNEFILLFLPIVLLVFHAGRHLSVTLAFNFLTLASLFFYAYGEPRFILILLTSVTVNYFLGCHLITNKNGSLLKLGIIGNLFAIGYFKYTNFFIGSLNSVSGEDFPLADIALPLGISFYTFQKVAFLVDAYRSKIRKPDFVEYLLFVSFFPQLIAGPIVHFNQIEAQLRRRDPVPLRIITAGLFLYCIGLFKKSVFADFVGSWADLVFDNPAAASPIQSLMAIPAYTLQIYFDFSGYSDMAIGLGMLFGIVLPINFNSPYKSLSIVEFWRRWHITLSTWLKDYVYIPLGGRGNSDSTRTFNLLVTMLVGGLWHGAAWTFVVWGGLHGLALAVNHAWLKIRPAILIEGAPLIRSAYSATSWFITFVTVSLLWVFFRAHSFIDVFTVFNNISQIHVSDIALSLPDLADYFSRDSISFSVWLFSQPGATSFCGVILLLLAMGTWLAPNSNWWCENFRPCFSTAFFCAFTLCLVITANIFLVTPNAFIYFRF